MATFAATNTITLSGSLTTTSDLTTRREDIAVSKSKVYASGVGANQADEFFSDQRTVTAAAETLDLTSGLTNAFGTAISLTKLKMILIHNTSTTTGETLLVSGNFGSILTGTTPKVTVGPDGWLVLSSPVDGFTVTNTTADQLTIDPGANTITYDLIIVGVT